MPTSETMRLFDTINNHQVLIFVDSGSTHNFIQSRITKFLALQSALTPPVKVLVGNDTTMDYDTSCPQIPMLIQGHRFMVDFFALPHSGADVALGVQWLCEL